MQYIIMKLFLIYLLLVKFLFHGYLFIDVLENDVTNTCQLCSYTFQVPTILLLILFTLYSNFPHQ